MSHRRREETDKLRELASAAGLAPDTIDSLQRASDFGQFVGFGIAFSAIRVSVGGPLPADIAQELEAAGFVPYADIEGWARYCAPSA